MKFESTRSFAEDLDKSDPLSHFRDRFHLPEMDGEQVIYFCGNSLGLQPKSASQHIEQELRKWKTQAVEGHFTEPKPWVSYHYHGKKELASLLGAMESEVVAMNSLTTNLHLLFATFYQPTEKKSKVLIEKGSFPSDYFAVTTHMQQKGIDAKENLIELPYDEHQPITTDSILEFITRFKDELSLVFLPGVQYYTGQVFDLEAISRICRQHSISFGVDLAHAIGNIPIRLHDLEIDFAVWCSYKYLNSGPGSVGGAFVHSKHGQNTDLPRLGGWWGQREDIRFQMENDFQPMPGVDGWMLSNVNVFGSVAHLASLEIFYEAEIGRLRKKSILLTGFLLFLLEKLEQEHNFHILTPKDVNERGCQLSLFFEQNGKNVFDVLTRNKVLVDWRASNLSDINKGVIRVAPTPLYNTFEEVFRFYEILRDELK